MTAYVPHPSRLGRLPAKRLPTFASVLDRPGSRVVGVLWNPGGFFETVLHTPPSLKPEVAQA